MIKADSVFVDVVENLSKKVSHLTSKCRYGTPSKVLAGAFDLVMALSSDRRIDRSPHRLSRHAGTALQRTPFPHLMHADGKMIQLKEPGIARLLSYIPRTRGPHRSQGVSPRAPWRSTATGDMYVGPSRFSAVVGEHVSARHLIILSDTSFLLVVTLSFTAR